MGLADRSGQGGARRWRTGFTSQFLDDLTHWVRHDSRTALRLTLLMKNVSRDPFTGVGKPEQLKHIGPGMWSRRISQEHRLVYQVDDAAGIIWFLQARYHY